MTKKSRKRYTDVEALKASTPEELTWLIVEKVSDREGWTFGAAVDVNIQRGDEAIWAKGELKVHRSGKPKGAYGIVRKVVNRLAPTCATLDELIAAMEREKGADREIVDVADGEVSFNDNGRTRTVTYKTLRDYLHDARSGK